MLISQFNWLTPKPRFSARILLISHIWTELLPIWCPNDSNWLPWQQEWICQKFWMTVCLADPKTPSLVQKLLTYRKSPVSWVMLNLMWKFAYFYYHGNRWWSDTNFTDTVKSADPQNPYLVQESWRYLMYKLSCSWFCVHMTTAGCRHNKGVCNWNLNDIIWFPDHKNLVKTCCLYIIILVYQQVLK